LIKEIKEAEKFLSDYSVLPDSRFLLPLVLWAAHTHAWESSDFSAVAYVNFTGARDSGKNHTIHALGSMSSRFIFVPKATEAALRDIVNDNRPTLGVAECEDDLRKHNSYVHRLFNSGYVPNEPFYKTMNGVPTRFQVFCPKMMATIGSVEESLHSRCIVVPMRTGNPAVGGDNFANGIGLGRQIGALVAQHAGEISHVYHSKTALKRPELLEGRDWQILRPLYAVCKVLVPERMDEFDRCATYITAVKTRPPLSLKDMHAQRADDEFFKNSKRVVKDAAVALVGYTGKNVASVDLIRRLRALPHGWWEGYGYKGGSGLIVELSEDQSGQQLLAKMFALVAREIIIPRNTPLYISKSVTKHGYVVSEIREAARALA
jgi:hypothetical protein